MNIFQSFQTTCRKYPHKICIKTKKDDAYEGLTYGELYERVSLLRSELLRAGIKPGCRVAILLSNGPYWPAAFFAAVSVQAVAVPVDAQLGPEEIRNILVHSSAKMLLTEDRFGVSLGAVFTWGMGVGIIFVDRLDEKKKADAQPDGWRRGDFGTHKLAALFYTSGTTQSHKAVMLTHKNLLANYRSIVEVGVVTSDDVLVSLLSLHHVYPFMVTCLVPLLTGATVCYLVSVVHHELFSCIKENKVTIFVGVPQLFSLMERSIADRMRKYGVVFGWSTQRLMDLSAGVSGLLGRNFSKIFLKGLHQSIGSDLKCMVSGGAKLDPRVARSFYRWGFRIMEGYGLTETSPVLTFNGGTSSHFESVGKAVPGVEIKIIASGEDGIGEIAARGENVMLGYYRLLSLTKKAVLNRWFMTGDLGYLEKNGSLHITGRINELIVLASGKKVNPEVVEAHYLKSPFIKEICVLFVKGGFEAGHLVAVIVPNEDELRVQKHVNIDFKIHWELDSLSQKVPPYQRVKGYVLSKEALPRTRLGKLIRHKIEEKYNAGGFRGTEKAAESTKGLSGFELMAVKYFSKILKKEVHLDDHLELDLGLDSLGRIELLSSLQELVNTGIDDSLALELFQARTVRDIVIKARQALPESAFLGFLKREDTIFWSNVLKEPLSLQEKDRLKVRFDIFDKFVSGLEALIVTFKFRVLFSVKVKGKENIPKDGPFVIAPNHVSFLDPFFILCALPLRLVIKTYFAGFGSIFKHPLLAWAVRFHRLIPIDANLDLAKALKVCRFVLQEGNILVYFPEGQRSADGGLKDFRKGVGILAKESNVRVLPVYIEGAYKAWPRTRAFPLLSDIIVKIGPCLDIAELSVAGSGEENYVVIAENLRAKVAVLEAGAKLNK